MTTDNVKEAAAELKKAATTLKNEAVEVAKDAAAVADDAADKVKDAAVEAVKGDDADFSIKRSLGLIVFLPIGAVIGWLVVAGTGGLGYEAKEAAAAAQSLVSKANVTDPVADEARRVASETAERVATRVSTEVATRVARDVASKVARDVALKAIENVQ